MDCVERTNSTNHHSLAWERIPSKACIRSPCGQSQHDLLAVLQGKDQNLMRMMSPGCPHRRSLTCS